MRLSVAILFFLSISLSGAIGQSRPEGGGYVATQEASRTVQVFPNPTTDFVHIRVTDIPVNKLTFKLHNIIGNEIQIEAEILSEHELRLKVKDLVAGYYLLAFKDEKNTFQSTYKFLKL